MVYWEKPKEGGEVKDYKVTVSPGNVSPINAGSQTGTIISGLQPGNYTISVVSENSAGQSEPTVISAVVCAKPSAVSNLEYNIYGSKVYVSWNPH